jgi:hypothetical protein
MKTQRVLISVFKSHEFSLRMLLDKEKLKDYTSNEGDFIHMRKKHWQQKNASKKEPCDETLVSLLDQGLVEVSGSFANIYFCK